MGWLKPMHRIVEEGCFICEVCRRDVPISKKMESGSIKIVPGNDMYTPSDVYLQKPACENCHKLALQKIKDLEELTKKAKELIEKVDE